MRGTRFSVVTFLGICRCECDSAISIAKTDTTYSADCIEFCPFEGYKDFFVCGTYQVIEPAKSSLTLKEDDEEGSAGVSPHRTERTGRLFLHQVGEDQASM